MKNNVVMPRIGANDNYVTLCDWNVKEGDWVSKGQTLAQIETTKESGEIEAEVDGYIQLIADVNQSINVGEVIAIISDVYEKQSKVEMFVEECEPTISIKAKKMIEQYGIDTRAFEGCSIVREKDVINYLEQLKKEPEKLGDVHILEDEPMENRVLINGGAGLCKMVVEILQQRGEFRVDGILDRNYEEGKQIKGIPVIDYNDEKTLKKYYDKGYRNIINAIAFDRNKHDRKDPYILMKKCGYKMINVIHNRAIIEPSVRIGEGNFIAANAMLGTDVRIGNNCMINAGTIISHDCVIGSHSHIASGTVLGGGVVVGENTLIGQGCTVFKGIKIGKNVVISNGVHIFENVPDGAIIR